MNMNAIALNQVEKTELKRLVSKELSQMTSKEKERLLQLGAKDFSTRFSDTIKKLATE